MPKSTRATLDLTRVKVLPFSEETVVNRFDSGRTPVDRFLRNKAKKATRRVEQRVFCAHIDASPNAVGYFALQIGTDSVADLPTANKRTYLYSYTAFPAVNMGFIGVDERYQGQGLGKYLLMDVFDKVAAISEHAGLYALTLQSLDDKSTTFYRHLGFKDYSENIDPPKMLYPIQDILTLVYST